MNFGRAHTTFILLLLFGGLITRTLAYKMLDILARADYY